MTLVEGAIKNEAERLDALAALTEMSLVKYDALDDGTDSVIVHRLVQTVARVRSEANDTAHAAAARLMRAIERVTADPSLHTPDLGGKATTVQVTDAVCTALSGDNA